MKFTGEKVMIVHYSTSDKDIKSLSEKYGATVYRSYDIPNDKKNLVHWRNNLITQKIKV